MDATPKGPPVPPTPDILSPLFSRGISDLNLTRRGQRYRRLSRHPTLDAARTTETTAYASSSSCTCLYRLFRRKLKQSPSPYRPVPRIRPARRRKSIIAYENGTSSRDISENRRFRCPSLATGGNVQSRPSTNTGTPTIFTILYLPSDGNRRTFFTPVFTQRPTCHAFDAFSTRTPADDQPRRARKLRLRGVDYPVKHIYRLRPDTPNYVPPTQPNRTREQCRAALPRVLWKKPP